MPPRSAHLLEEAARAAAVTKAFAFQEFRFGQGMPILVCSTASWRISPLRHPLDPPAVRALPELAPGRLALEACGGPFVHTRDQDEKQR